MLRSVKNNPLQPVNFPMGRGLGELMGEAEFF